MPVKICFCYSSEDESLLKKLKAHLRPMQREGLIEAWYDRDILPGVKWEEKRKEQLESAEIILLLLSSDFMDSDYCYSTEMQQALARHNRGNATVIPIILRPVYWQGALGQLQALPKNELAVTDPEWHSIDKALFNVAEGIRMVVIEEIIQQYLYETDELAVEGKHNEAIALYEKVISLKTSCSDAYVGKGFSLFCLEQYEDALAAYNQAIFYDQHEFGLYGWKAQILLRLGRYEEALACCDQVISLDPTHSYHYRNRGTALRKLGRYEDALTAYEQAISFDAEDGDVYELKGDTLSKLRRYEEALIAYDKFIQLYGTDEEVLSKKGEVLSKLRRYEEALTAFDEAIQLNPGYINSYLCKGNMLLFRNLAMTSGGKSLTNALDTYEKATNVDPDSVPAWRGKSSALLRLKRYEEALTVVTRAIEINPADNLSWNLKAEIYEQLAQQSHKKAKQFGYHFTEESIFTD